jgi:uncharacterized protein YndB with AHSA1/START domain
MNIDPNALVITRDEIAIAAAPERVWELFTDVNAWPEWQSEISSGSLDGPLALGSTIIWSTAGLEIASTVGEFIPGERIVWSGLARGIMGIHVWTFAPADGGTLVHTEESWDGASVRPQIGVMQPALDRSIRFWLESLKAAAEREL